MSNRRIEKQEAHKRAAKAINTATFHVEKASMKSSAVLCLADAVALLPTNPKAAHMWALKSLAYSVGVFHPDYVRTQL